MVNINSARGSPDSNFPDAGHADHGLNQRGGEADVGGYDQRAAYFLIAQEGKEYVAA